ncbi:hypothetical protein [Hyphomicrobium sp.]|uniref:hypothetical protein n=1 Tax=Hyphomicrobium sp. TaxID=82 RepID=UPI002B70401D|nr:hypothetical protein [Hyphomicrobium sp.]HRN89936.1 hypothetical protein [Hyphomicrobium sp.]HRQ28154.1 hypothetical protein [Hyphomicrobium sp.]
MIKALETAIEKVKRLPPDKQAYAARVLDDIANEDGGPFIVPNEHRAAVLEALDQLDLGERTPGAKVDKLLREPWA